MVLLTHFTTENWDLFDSNWTAFYKRFLRIPTAPVRTDLSKQMLRYTAFAYT